MGKALTNLKKSIKECYEYEYDDSENDIIDDSYSEYDDSENIEELSFKIKYALINYSKNSGYPLCEYLDIDKINYYVKWLLHNNSLCK